MGERKKETRKTRRVRTLDAREGNTHSSKSRVNTPRRIVRPAVVYRGLETITFQSRALTAVQNSKSNRKKSRRRRRLSRTSLIAHRVQRHAQLRLDQRSTRPVRERADPTKGGFLLLRGRQYVFRRRRRHHHFFFLFGEKEKFGVLKRLSLLREKNL